MPKLKPKFYKTVNFFDLSLFCICYGYKDNNGEPLKYASPLNINDILREVTGFSCSYSAPLLGGSIYHEFVENSSVSESSLALDVQDKALESSVEQGGQDVLGSAEGSDVDVVYAARSSSSFEKCSLEETSSGEVSVDSVEAVNDEAVVEDDKPARVYNGGKLDVYLQDIREFEDCFVLLINSTNLNSSHGVTRDVTSGVRKEEQLTVDQGADLSTHIIVFKDTEDCRQRCLVEKTSGLSTSILKSFFDYLGKLVVENDKKVFEIDDPDGKLEKNGGLKKRTIWPRITFQGHPCESFFQDLENGYMNGIYLVGEPKNFKAMDVEVPVDFQEVIIKIDAKVGDLETPGKKIQRLMKYGKSQNLDKLRVTFKDASGSPHTREIDMEEPLGKDNLEYVKKRRIGMAFRPKSSYSQVRREFVKKMLEVADE
ncbi:hypothetical protein FEI13_17270 [Halomonas urmiana]|uniref:Uncharacterized protein n=1 Tax=Halomonas urmiana TaxID=490901 RepID=A0A5R8MBA5_9GAMM|nr:hypothetical protein [Halomonas urmiana]TLF46039.1 hypothetical protein FEI13_17270 [Halomonas urmiana]